ncbi:MAG: hypothetical protein AB1894_20795 [Chloroflexota bacterium]
MSENSIDLAEFVSGFPQQPDVEVPRDAIIRKIIRDLGSSRQLMIAANAYTGKTNLLAQFVRSHKDSAISYFINSNPWTQQQHNFLHTLCSQLRIILGGKAFADDISLEMLKTVFSSQCAKLAEIARTNKTIYYFIIDGLEWALEGLEGERIIDIFPPPTFPRSPFLLCSCATNSIVSLPKHILDIKRLDVSLDFNLSDTQYFFSNLNLPSEVVESIHLNSQGIPEYLSIIKNDIMSNSEGQWKPDNLPTQLDQLIQRQLDKFYLSVDRQVIKAFEYLAVTSVPLPIDTLCGGLDQL